MDDNRYAGEYEEETSNFHDIRLERRLAKKRKRRRRAAGVAAVIAVCIAGFALKDRWMPAVADFFEASKETIINDGTPKVGGGFPIELGQSDNYILTSLEEYPVVISDTRIIYYDKNGAQINSFQHLFAEPICYQMKKRLFVYDLNGSNFSVYDDKGEVYSKETDNTIILAAAGSGEYVAVVTQTDKYSSYLTIYDGSGKEVFKWSSGQRIVSVAFNAKETGCIVSTITAQGGRMVSKLFGLEFDKTEELFETEYLDCLIYKATYCDNGDMWIVGDSILYRVSSDGSVEYSYEYSKDLRLYDTDGKCAVLVFDTITGNGSEILMFSDNGEPAEFYPESKVIRVKADEGQAMYLTADSFAVLNSNGKTAASADVTQEYSDFLMMKGSVYFLGYNEIDKVEFKS